MSKLAKIGFGGGCHWCTEAVFASLKGVDNVDQGFIRSDPPDDGWSEAVHLAFDPAVIPLEVLIDIHLRTHASTSDHSMRGKYRSAIYVHDTVQAAVVQTVLSALQPDFRDPLVTRVLPHRDFKFSDPRFHRYFETKAGGPFCTRYIDPKLDRLRRNYAVYLQPGAPTQKPG